MAEWQGRSGVALCHPSLTSAGKAILTKAIRRAGWSTDQFTSCQPHDIPAGTRAIVALGDQAQEALTGWFGGKRSVKYTRGYLLQGFSGLPVVPTFDPTQLAQGQMKLLGLLMNDIGVALQAAVGARKVCLDPKTVTNYRVGLDALRELYAEAVADPNLLVAFDLETATSWGEDEDESIEFSRDAEDEVQDDVEGGNGDDHESIRPGQGGSLSRDALSIERAGIRTVQFSLHPGTGVSCDWSDECRDWVQRIMSLPNPLAGHNQALFDTPILERHGIVFNGGGPIHDTLWMAHHLQPDLPVHLQGVASWINFPFPWKHMSGADLDFYGSVDVDSVQWVMRDLPPKLKRLGLWEGYERYVRQFRPVLAAMEKRGIPVSKSKLEELRTWLGQEIARMDSELQPMIPEELKGRKYWKTWPADTKPFVEEYKQDEIAQIKSCLEAEGKKVTKKALTLVVKPKDLPEPHRSIISEELGYRWEGDQLYKTLDFNPRSSDQILQFIRAKGYPVPKRFKDQKDTTSDKELAKLEVKTKDPALGLVRSIRAYSKMSNAYAGKQLPDGTVEGGWQPGPDGFLRATFTFGPATWQLSARNPNVMTTPKRRKELAIKFRQCIEAPPGYKLVSFDFKSFHALTTALEARDPLLMRLSRLDVHSFLAGHLVKYPGIETCTDMSDADLAEYLEEIKSKHKNVREFQAKPCIAEGELVLTDKGLKAIETVKLDDKVWDGVEWVSHDGVICKGLKETIQYDGLRATADHKIYTEDGRTVSFGQAAQEMARLERTGAGWKAIRTRNHYQSEVEENQGLHPCILPMHKMWPQDLDLQEQSLEGQDQWLSVLFFHNIETFRSVGSPIRWDGGSLQTSSKSGVSTLRSSRNRAAVQFAQRIHSLGRGEFAPSRLSGSGDRSDRQQWSLRAWKFKTGYAQGTGKQPTQYCQSLMERGVDSGGGLPQPLWLRPHTQNGSQVRVDRGGDHSPSFNDEGSQDPELAENRGTVKTVRVYDILNAGPRHRFTVSNVLVSNCVHGTNFGQSARRMYFEYADHFENQAAANKLLDLYKALFPKLFKYQEDVCEEADRNGRLITKWGAIRWFFDVKRWVRRDGKWVSVLGRDAEKVKAFKPSNDAHGMFRDKVLQAHERGWTEKYGLCNLIHDDTLWMCPDNLVEECIANVKPLLESPVPELADPVMCPDGFVCGVDGSVGNNWADMKGIK